MKDSFDSVAYTIGIGQELVSNFEKAGFATTPGQVGSAREVPTREKLEQLLPRGIAVGSGCVIDSFGSTSRQMDVVLYEKDFCPVYSINGDPQTTYYPCEGVIAVGEIKSTFKDLEDIFYKAASAKRLRRYIKLQNDQPATGIEMEAAVAFRKYGSPIGMVGAKSEAYNQDMKPLDQIFSFSLAGALGLSPQTFCEKYVGFAKQIGYEFSPNLIVTLEGGILCPIMVPPDRHNPTIAWSLLEANNIYYVKNPNGGFQFLLSRLYEIYRSGRTVGMHAFDRYFVKDGIVTLPTNGTCVELQP